MRFCGVKKPPSAIDPSLPASKVTNKAYKRSKIGVPFISLAGTGAQDGDSHVKYWNVKKGLYSNTGFIRGILRGVRYAKSLRVLFLHRRSPSWTTLVLYSRVVFIFNEPTISLYAAEDVL